MSISIIAAMDRNRVIGQHNRLPWHLPADFIHFKNITMGKPIVMGRKTYDSIGRVLPGRRNIIISHDVNLHITNCEVIHSLEKIRQIFVNEDEILIIGGAHLFEQALPFTQRLYLTLIDAEFVGDTYFPSWESSDWQETARENYKADAHNHYDYHFITLDRK